MIVAVKANQFQKEEWLKKQAGESAEIAWVDNDVPHADAYFDLLYDEQGASFPNVHDKPVFVSGMFDTLNELPSNVSRINAWQGFLKRDIAEVVLRGDSARLVLHSLNWKFHEVPDVAGMIAGRTISMIVNEAYFALGDNVSSKEDIDIAMKLGTNYPFGPFEWSKQIGLHTIYRLLKKLSLTDPRYQPSPALEQELKSIA